MPAPASVPSAGSAAATSPDPARGSSASPAQAVSARAAGAHDLRRALRPHGPWRARRAQVSNPTSGASVPPSPAVRARRQPGANRFRPGRRARRRPTRATSAPPPTVRCPPAPALLRRRVPGAGGRHPRAPVPPPQRRTQARVPSLHSVRSARCRSRPAVRCRAIREGGTPFGPLLAAFLLGCLVAAAGIRRSARRIDGDGAVLPDDADLLRELDPAHRARVHDRGRGHLRAPSAAARS